MFDIVRKIITKWDPIELMSFSPPDEYDIECQSIIEEYEKTTEKLSKIIYSVFRNSFGEEFNEDFSKCEDIAVEIEKEIQKNI